MLRVIDTDKELSYINKVGIPDLLAGIQYSGAIKPLDFQYYSTEAITSFQAIKIDSRFKEIETLNLDTSLVTLSSNRHICTGQTELGVLLDECIYFFRINGHYDSEPFLVTNDIVPNAFDLSDGGEDDVLQLYTTVLDNGEDNNLESYTTVLDSGLDSV